MFTFDLDPVLLQIGGPALAVGILLGALVTWLLLRRRQRGLQARVRNQEALQQEREIAFEAANAQLTKAFAELANQSLQSNSENFLRLADENKASAPTPAPFVDEDTAAPYHGASSHI